MQRTQSISTFELAFGNSFESITSDIDVFSALSTGPLGEFNKDKWSRSVFRGTNQYPVKLKDNDKPIKDKSQPVCNLSIIISRLINTVSSH